VSNARAKKEELDRKVEETRAEELRLSAKETQELKQRTEGISEKLSGFRGKMVHQTR
jgi:hypothetical protein